MAEQHAAYFAEFYKKDKIRGGHIILLNPSDSSYYKETETSGTACTSHISGWYAGWRRHSCRECQRIYRGSEPVM